MQYRPFGKLDFQVFQLWDLELCGYPQKARIIPI